MLKRKNFKKGSIGDLLTIVIICMVASILILVGYKVTSSFNTYVAADPTMPAEAVTASSSLTATYPGVIDGAFLFLIVGVSIVSLVMASLVRVHPVFVIFFLISWAFVIFFAGIASNVYEQIASEGFSTEATNMTMMSHVMAYLPIFIGVFGALLAIVMYKGWSNAQDGGLY